MGLKVEIFLLCLTLIFAQELQISGGMYEHTILPSTPYFDQIEKLVYWVNYFRNNYTEFTTYSKMEETAR